MGTGAITQYVDVAQLVLYLFWAFFAGLMYYLIRENHREGYPMDTGRVDGPLVTGWPTPQAKTFKLRHGGEITVPRADPMQSLPAVPRHGWVGAPLVPTGDLLSSGMGPGAWANRADVPELAMDDRPVIVPLRVASEFSVAANDPDPRGMTVLGADDGVAGTVRDLWIDRSEAMFRYLEVELPMASGGRTVMLPFTFARITRNDVRVQSLLAAQLAGVPALRNPDQVTVLEEEKITAYYGAGTLYAEPSRAEPLV